MAYCVVIRDARDNQIFGVIKNDCDGRPIEFPDRQQALRKARFFDLRYRNGLDRRRQLSLDFKYDIADAATYIRSWQIGRSFKKLLARLR